MDISEQYIRMCKKAVEIQSLADKPNTGRYVYDNKFCVDENDRLWLADDKIWLPRQDQLQSMIERTNLSKFYKFKSFVYNSIVNELDDSDEADLPSFEQIWLRFVMLAKFNKIWNGKDWISG